MLKNNWCFSSKWLGQFLYFQMAVLDFLTELMRGLVEIIQDSHCRALTAYISGLLQRSKLQKCLLHSLLTSVHNVRQHNNTEM